MLIAAIDLILDVHLIQLGAQFFDDLFDIIVLCELFHSHTGDQTVVGLRLQRLQRQVFQFKLDLGDPQPVRQRRVNIQRLLALLHDLGVRHKVDGSHIMEAVSQFDDQHPDILGHSQEHFSQILGLTFFFAVGFDGSQFRDPVYQSSDIFAEILFDIFIGVVGVFHDVMHQSCGNGLGVHPQLGKNFGDLDRVDEIRLSGTAELTFMCLLGQVERLPDEIEIILRVVFF